MSTVDTAIFYAVVGTIFCASYWSAWSARVAAIEQDKLLKAFSFCLFLLGNNVLSRIWCLRWCSGYQGKSYGIKCIFHFQKIHHPSILFHMMSSGVLDTKSWTEHPSRFLIYRVCVIFSCLKKVSSL